MFYENFERLCKENKTNPSSVAESIGLGLSTPAGWKKNGTIPKQDVLDKLATHLQCKVEDFFRDSSGTVMDGVLAAVTTLARNLEVMMDEYGTVSIAESPSQTREEKEFAEALGDFVRIYSHCPDRKAKTRLMNTLYDFEDYLDATYGEGARNADYEAHGDE